MESLSSAAQIIGQALIDCLETIKNQGERIASMDQTVAALQAKSQRLEGEIDGLKSSAEAPVVS